MKRAICYLESDSPYSQSKHHDTPKLDKELPSDYENRTWRERMHCDKDGIVFIPATQFMNSIKVAAKYLNIQIAGKGKITYTKHFESGIMVVDNLSLGIHKDNAEKESVYVPSDGRVGGTTRVTKHFCLIPQWEGKVTYYILDNIITQDIFEEVLRECGSLIGVGRFRPRNRGWYGRFRVKKVEWFNE
jgi:hypothetical protein